MRVSLQRAERLSLAALLLQVLGFALMLWNGAATGSPAIRIEAWHFLGGSLVWFILFLQFRQRRLADEERFEAQQYDSLRREGKDTSVFGATAVEGAMHLAARRLVWLEKYLLAVFSILIAAYLIAVGVWQYFALRQADLGVSAGRDRLLISAVIMAGVTFVTFLFSRYAVGMSRQSEWRALRAGGSYLFSNALVCFLAIFMPLLALFIWPGADRIFAYVLAIGMVVIGIEVILNLVLDAYRPRIKGQYQRAAFESRALGLMCEPGGILQTAAHMVDYQFGFKVSETWFYQLLVKAVLPLVVCMVIILFLLTCIVSVPAGCVGVLERWGRPVNAEEPLQSGFHVKAPWPMDIVRVFPTERVSQLDIGFERFEEEADNKPVLWSMKHWKEEYPFVVARPRAAALPTAATGLGEQAIPTVDTETVAAAEASPDDFDLLVMALVVHYRISDVAQYAYGADLCYRQPETLIESICYREAVHFAAHRDIESLMGPGRNQTALALHSAIQERSDEAKLGVEVLFVGLESVHPPMDVAESFEKVVSAFQQKQALILQAQGARNDQLAQVRGGSAVRLAYASAAADERRLTSKAAADRFAQQRLAYEKGGDVYLSREYLSVLDEYLPAMRKYVMASDNVGHWVYEFDLKEKLQPDLFDDLGLPGQETSQ